MNKSLFIVRLVAYGIEKSSLDFISSLLKPRKRRAKVNSWYSFGKTTISGVAQGSILGSFPFNIFICDMFFEAFNIGFPGFADSTTLYTYSDNIETVLTSRKH